MKGLRDWFLAFFFAVDLFRFGTKGFPLRDGAGV